MLSSSCAAVPVPLIRPALDGLRGAGLDISKLLRASGIDPAVCDDATAHIASDRLLAFWEAARAASGCETLGLRAAEFVCVSSFDVFGYIMRSSATAHDALRRRQRYAMLAIDPLFIQLTQEGDRAVICQVHQGSVPRIVSDFTLAVMVRMGREVHGPTFPLLEVRVSYPTPVEANEYSAYFRAPVRFGCDYDAIVLPMTLLNNRQLHADEHLCSILERQADEELKAWWSAQKLSTRVHRVLGEQLHSGQSVAVERVAKKLGVSPRTLRRQLQKEDTSYSQLLDKQRRRLAMHHIEQGRKTADIASALGFTGSAAFSRAYKRWTQADGGNPTRARKAP
jgi:AraC-like DNA-binding protein